MRLIDADEFIKRVGADEGFIKYKPYSTCSDESFIGIYQGYVAREIIFMPTAYDIDKVVEELRSKLAEKSYQHQGEDYYVGIMDAIEIVKAGEKNGSN